MLKTSPFFKQNLGLPLMLLLVTTACSQAVSAPVVSPSITSVSSEYQLQMLKNCEFVKQRARIIIGQQAGIALGEIAHIDHDGPHIPAKLALAAHRRIPSTGSL